MNDDELLPAPIRDSVCRGKVVAFVGAGFTMPLGFPGWQALLDNLVGFCRARVHSVDEKKKLVHCQRLVRSGQLIEAAGELKRLITPVEYSVFIREQFNFRRREDASPSAITDRMTKRHHHLINTPWAGIVTTNFDDYIRPGAIDWRAKGNDPLLGSILANAEPFYVKLHTGRWDEDVVLTSEDYLDAYFESDRLPTLPHFLRALMLSHQLIFIGCSLEHRILELRLKLSHVFKGMLPLAWALVPKSKANTDRADLLKRDYQIQLITYPVNEPGKEPHDAVDRFLKLAAHCSAHISIPRTEDGGLK